MKLHVSATDAFAEEPVYCLRDAADLRIASVKDAPNALDTTLRLSACWNACQSIPTEALEAGVVEEMVGALETITNGWTGRLGHQEIARAILARVRP